MANTVAAAATVLSSSQNIGQHFDPLQIAFAHRYPAHSWKLTFLMGGNLTLLISAYRSLYRRYIIGAKETFRALCRCLVFKPMNCPASYSLRQ
jgi:hypothetical protein